MHLKSFKLTSVVFASLFLSACSQMPKNNNTAFNLLEPRYGHATVTDGERLITLAGSNSSGFLTDVEILNPKTGEQKKLDVQVMPRRYFSAVYAGEQQIYIFGGDGDGPGNTNAGNWVEMLDLKTNQVSIVSKMQGATAFDTAVLFREKIIVFGGSQYRHHAGSMKEVATPWVQSFDLKTKRWKRLADLAVARATRAVVKDDWIYLVGGYDGHNSLPLFERYQPATGRREQLPDLPQPISAHSAVVSGNQLLVFGDYTEMDASYSYDFTLQRWQKLEVGYQASRHQSATAIGNKVFVTGGNTGGDGAFLSTIQPFEF
ncbi:MAG: hypothetical protein KJ930_07140 [Gammaproteobacteria bacterium]|nr:hypothetical protein [Gammaproteobacteria bacterium]